MTAKEAIFRAGPIPRAVRAGSAAALAIAAFAAGPAQASTIGVGGDVSSAGGDAAGSRLAVNATGDAAFTWTQENGGTDEVKARLRSGNALGAVKAISAIGVSAEDPAVAIEPD